MSAQHERIRSALSFIPPGDRDTWLRMGMAIKSDLGEDGFSLWDEWSQGDGSYNERDLRITWRSLKANGKVTVGTLFYEAQQRGWKDNGEPVPLLSLAEAAARHERQAEAEAEEARRKAEARENAASIWKAAQPASNDHPYLKRKGVEAHGLRLHQGQLVIPMRDANGELHSLQFIGAEGDKKFLTDGRKASCYFSIGDPKGLLCIAEGYATTASIHEATGYPVAVAFDAGNLEPVARELRTKFPELKLIVCADNDIDANKGNTGLEKATKAALVVGGLVAIPYLDGEKCDFNDLYQKHGAEAVQRAIANAAAPPKVRAQATNEYAPAASGNSEESIVDAIARLAALSPIEFDRVCNDEAKKLGCKASTLEQEVKKARRETNGEAKGAQGQAVSSRKLSLGLNRSVRHRRLTGWRGHFRGSWYCPNTRRTRLPFGLHLPG